MSTPATAPLGTLLRAAAYVLGLFVLGEIVLLRIPAEDGWALFGEYQRVETLHTVLLSVLVLLCAWTAVASPVARPLAVLLTGLAAGALVREHNNWWKDEVGDNVWQAVVGGVLLLAALLAWRLGGSLRTAMHDLLQRPAFGWMAAGTACALFGQLLDERSLWDLLVAGGAPYAAQRMAEESAEAVGLWLACAGALEWRLGAPREDAA